MTTFTASKVAVCYLFLTPESVKSTKFYSDIVMQGWFTRRIFCSRPFLWEL